MQRNNGAKSVKIKNLLEEREEVKTEMTYCVVAGISKDFMVVILDVESSVRD